ncbi:MAG: hypothetical protein AB3N16_15360 [Flavobacteriaceae bacterium]
MALKSHFKSDLEKEKALFSLLDRYYTEQLRHYHFQRITQLKQQLQGIDLILTHTHTGTSYFVDEKAQMDYINDDLPTFAFELFYQKKGGDRLGWFLDSSKKTQFYALVTAIYSDEPKLFTSCKITLVNRQKLLGFLRERKLDMPKFKALRGATMENHGKICVPELLDRTEGYLYHSKQNKAESPFNLILRLDFLIQKGLAKRLV